MSKKRQEKRKLKAKKNRRRQLPKQRNVAPRSAALRSTVPAIPSAHTMWRSMNIDFRNQESVAKALTQFQSSVVQRDAAHIEQIQNAPDVEALLDLTPIAVGLADYAWITRMRDFGPAVAKNVAERLNNSDWMRAHEKARSGIQEMCVGALRWYGEEGVEALLSCWDSLDDYGQSIICIALGLLGARQAADRIFDCYQKALNLRRDNYFIGALWGLIDLQDERAADALLSLLKKQRPFYELFGFLSRAGDQRAILPLIERTIRGPDEIQGEAVWALTGIAHRIGRTAFTGELSNLLELGGPAAGELERSVNHMFKFSFEEVKNHFELFYAGEAVERPVSTSVGGRQLKG
jgi:hypothetical protein